MRPDLPTGTVTFLFTDIEGSTRLLHALGPDDYADALAEHRRVLREAFAAHDGVEVDTQGDAFFVAFPTADGAAAAALEARDALAAGPITVRMGLHTGTPTVTAEGYVGVDVHRGARVGALAHGRQIVLSPATAALLEDESLCDLGTHRLKDFDGAVRLFQLGLDPFPPLRTPGSVELPTPATRFLGREHELFEAVSLVVERDPRVLTVLGPGGTGKTRFALELCRLLAEEADGGTVFCALAPLREPELVLQSVAERLGAASSEPAAIAARIGGKRTHVLVDNAEHLLPEAARPLAELAAAAPALRLFVTSREPLRIQGEAELDLPPLAESEAVSLFCERAQAVRPDVRESEAVHELCARLDHLPLALELAAARTKLLSPEALLERLEARLDLLKGTRDADERHATLRATIAWSYDLLDAEEQRLFRRLAVFRGGCTLESVEAVCEADLDVLASLLDKSLVRRRTGRLSEERFWMLETIREFAAERLEASGEADELRRRHAERMLEVAQDAHLSEDDDEPFQLEIALSERDDIRAALDWAQDHDPELGVSLAVSLETFWNAHAPEEGQQRLTTLLERARTLPDGLRARGLRVLGNTTYNVDVELTRSVWEEGLALSRALGDDRGAALILHRLALLPFDRGDLEETRRMIDESHRLAAGRSQLLEAVNLWMYAQLEAAEGRIDAAVELTRRSAETASEIEWSWWVSGQHGYLSLLALGSGDFDGAEREARASLLIAQTHENRQRSAGALAALARAALRRGELVRAGLLWGAAEAELAVLPTRFGVEWYGAELLDETDPTFASARAQGRTLELWEGVAIALGDDDAGGTSLPLETH
ncbi:MAG TPA: adenylate/guanylate cyclase domain-containing protein [Gaiellaceae bacterium]|nr:adenylate/guanylate cyclase domain-containing protein [Gaiellaceae bacterium]